MENKPMRALMPEITALVDALREHGMIDNATLAKGIKDGTFWAREGGHEIGKAPAVEKEGAVMPVLSAEAETRAADLQWKRKQEGRA